MPDPPVRRRIDTHGHLLPAVDDGSRSVEESLAIVGRMSEAGYAVLSCTPHIWPDEPFTPDLIRRRVATLQAHVDASGIDVKLMPGGELSLTELDVFALADDEIVTCGLNGTHVLFDFWDSELPADYWPRIERLQSAGLTCIQAHPERIAAFQNEPRLLDDLAARGVLLQCNLQCVTRLGGERANRCCERWLAERRYFMLGSDLHRVDSMDVRLAGLRRAIVLLGEAEVDRLTITNPAIALGLRV